MIEFEFTETAGFRPALRGMRNPKNSWGRSDSVFDADGTPHIGANDLKLAVSLCKGGPVHAKFRRMIIVWTDIIAPIYWWKECDTYKVGTVRNSCSTMHTITNKPFEIVDFSFENLGIDISEVLVKELERLRQAFKDTQDDGEKKKIWYQIIQLLPESYNQRATCMFSYEGLSGMYYWRKDHKLNEWHTFCDWVKTLPYVNELIIGGENNDTK